MQQYIIAMIINGILGFTLTFWLLILCPSENLAGPLQGKKEWKKRQVKHLARENKLLARFVWRNCPFSLHNVINI